MGLGKRRDPYLKQWSGMTRRQTRYATLVSVAAATNALMAHVQTHTADDLNLTAATAIPFQQRRCPTCRDLASEVAEHSRGLPRHQRDLIATWLPIAVMENPELADVRRRGAELIQTWPDHVDRSANFVYEADMIYHLERVEYLHDRATGDPLGPPEPVTQSELQQRLRDDVAQLRRDHASAVLLESSAGRTEAAFTSFEPWLQATIATLEHPQTAAALTAIVDTWRAERDKFLFDGGQRANVTIAHGFNTHND